MGSHCGGSEPRHQERLDPVPRADELAKQVTTMKTSLSTIAIAISFVSTSAAAGPDAAVRANTEFAFDLYAQLAEEQAGKNLFFSPFSVSSALAMVTEGARGETALQMGKVLRYPESLASDDRDLPWTMDPLHAGMAALNTRFNGGEDPKKVVAIKAQIAAVEEQLAITEKAAESARGDRKWKVWHEHNERQRNLSAELTRLRGQIDQYELNVANALWGEKSYPFKQEYFDKVRKYYQTGGVFPVDFRGEPEAVRGRINAWVEELTKERIKDLIPRGAVDRLTRLVLVNAIYFKGDWSVPFEAKRTRELDFTLADGSKVKRLIMNANSLEVAKFAAFNADGSFFKTPTRIQRGAAVATAPAGDGFSILELPYKGEELSMVLIAPGNPRKFEALEEMLTPAKLERWLSELQSRKVHVFMPKFKVETAYTLGDADQPGTLQKLGMTRAFVDPRLPSGAVFDGMSQAQSPTEKLYISKVLHKAFVEVNEEGTEAAAATAVLMPKATSVPTTLPFIPTFKADRPFVYLIRDRVTGSILFMGRMMDPAN